VAGDHLVPRSHSLSAAQPAIPPDRAHYVSLVRDGEAVKAPAEMRRWESGLVVSEKVRLLLHEGTGLAHKMQQAFSF
jgi:hypothetical protein